jgi:hypothetical protein
MCEVVLNSVALERSQSFWRLETRTTRRSCSMLRVGRVTWMVAGGCAVCHGGVWFAQGRKVRSTVPRDATPRFAPPRSAPLRLAAHDTEGSVI